MAWIQSHQTLAAHPKTRKLAHLLNVSKPAAIGHLHCFWWWALDYADDGDLSRHDALDIAIGAEWDGDAEAFLDAMRTAGFIDEDDDGARSIHDWQDYAGKLVDRRRQNAERMRNARASSQISRAAHVQRTHRARVELEKSREDKTKEDDSLPAKRGRDEESAEFQAFYAAYPRKTARGDAWKAWQSIKPTPELAAEILTAITAQAATTYKGKDKQYIPYPATWLRAQQWTDEIEEPAAGGMRVVGGGFDPLRRMPADQEAEYQRKLEEAKRREDEMWRNAG